MSCNSDNIALVPINGILILIFQLFNYKFVYINFVNPFYAIIYYFNCLFTTGAGHYHVWAWAVIESAGFQANFQQSQGHGDWLIHTTYYIAAVRLWYRINAAFRESGISNRTYYISHVPRWAHFQLAYPLRKWRYRTLYFIDSNLKYSKNIYYSHYGKYCNPEIHGCKYRITS